MTPLMIHDETESGTLLNQVCLLLEESSITVEELLRRRIEQEVESFGGNAGEGVFQLQPAGSHAALRPFRERGFVIFVNNRRVDDLGQEIEVSPNTSVRFVRC
ncbi:MAG: hypothetical protein J5I94_07010 [Phaeodactylibacter sp.]|nr:hypothetical protein [Phaeodactylibacter sp.]